MTMKFKIACCFFLVVVCLVACIKPPAATISEKNDSTNLQNDSTWTKETLTPDTIIRPGDTVRITTFIECDKATNKPKDMTMKVHGKNNELEIKLRNGLLDVMSAYDSLVLVTHHKDTEIHHLRETLIRVNKEKQEVKIKIEYKTYWFDTWARIIAIIVLIFLLFKIKNLITP
jgi:hypothetical protein